jgi:NTP pyrophosphatase (non-canonical NTP hydrolase)
MKDFDLESAIEDMDVVLPGDATQAQIAACQELFPGRRIGVRPRKRSMQSNEYQQLALRTEKTPRITLAASGLRPEVIDRLLHGMLGICTEAGELQDAIKKQMIYGKPLDITNVIEECGDLLWYIALTLDACMCPMSEAMERNIAKLKARYPEGFTEEKALTRDLAAELNALTGCTSRCTDRPNSETYCRSCGAAPGTPCK